MNLKKNGFTVVELIVYLVIFVLLLGGLNSFINWYRHANAGIQRLDVLHQIRVASFQIADEISYGSQILFPPVGSPKAYHQLSFKNNANEIVVVFRDEKQPLMSCNLMKKGKGENYLKVLTGNTIKFEVKRPSSHYVEYELTIRDDKGKKPNEPTRDFHLANSARIRNVVK